MATFGRRPAKGTSGRRVEGSSSGGKTGESEGFRRMKEEEAERERFAREFEEREEERRRDSIREQESVQEREVAAHSAGKPNPRVFLDVELRGPELLGRSGSLEAAGRLEFELYADAVPKTAENFKCLCTGERGRDLHFQRCIFHRIIPGFMAQGGDFTDGDGTGGRSIYGKTFADEGFSHSHDARGILSMANSGPNTNGSQFFILFGPAPHLNRKHVVFGRMTREEGQILKRIEAKGSKSGDVKGTVTINACGELREGGKNGKDNGKDKQSSHLSRTRSRRRSESRSRSRRQSRSRNRSLSRRRGKSRSRSRSSSMSGRRNRSQSSSQS